MLLNSIVGARVGNIPVKSLKRGGVTLMPGIANLITNPACETTSGTVEVWRNLATNPGFEANSSTVEVRRNLATIPAATAFATNVAGSFGFMSDRWANEGVYSLETGIVGPAGTGLTTAAALRTTVARAAGHGFHVLGNVEAASPATTYNALPVSPSQVVTISCYVRKSGVSVGVAMRVRAADSNGAWLSSSFWPAATATVDGAWVRVSTTYTLPANSAWLVASISETSGTDAVGDIFECTGLLIESSPALLPYFGGSYSPDTDLTAAWTGTANASASILTGLQVASTVDWGTNRNVRSSQWSLLGKSMRVIPTSASSNDTFAVVAGSDASLSGQGVTFVVGRTYTILATSRLAAAQTGTLNANARRIRIACNTVAGWTGATSTTSTQATNAAGVTEHRFSFTVPASAVWCIAQCYNGASSGCGDVWWDSLLLAQGNYTGPYFDGSFSPDTDLTAAWTGTANASVSILSGVPVTGIAGAWQGNGAISSSTWSISGAKSVRTIPTNSMDSYAEVGGGTGAMRLGMQAGKTYTFIATCRLPAPQTGTGLGNANGTRQVTLWHTTGSGYICSKGTQAPNQSGTFESRVTVALPANATEAFVRLYNGANGGGGDVWWDNIMLVEGNYAGPYRDGSSPGWAWTGTANQSTSFGLG